MGVAALASRTDTKVSAQCISGPELERELIRQGRAVPVIFITAHSDKSLSPGLMQDGVVDCLFKPFSEEDLGAALAAALPLIR